MGVTPFDAYRQQITRLLEVAKELLTEPEQDALRMAIAAARSNGVSLMLASPGLLPRAINEGERILAQLKSAD